MSSSKPLLRSGAVFADWEVLGKLGGGTFSEIYHARNKTSGRRGVLKVDRPPGGTLDWESKILRDMQRFPFVPRFYCHVPATEDTPSVLVMQVLGRSLSSLRAREPGEQFSFGVALVLVRQMLCALEGLHWSGYIHRDVKPSNFVVGKGREGRRTVFMLDFGQSRKYAEGQSGRGLRKARLNCEFRGTSLYASPNAHAGHDLGRRDDMWSLWYVLVSLLRGKLPWHHITSNRILVGDLKQWYTKNPGDLVKGLPGAHLLQKWSTHCSSLRFEDKPDYALLRSVLDETLAYVSPPPACAMNPSVLYSRYSEPYTSCATLQDIWRAHLPSDSAPKQGTEEECTQANPPPTAVSSLSYNTPSDMALLTRFDLSRVYLTSQCLLENDWESAKEVGGVPSFALGDLLLTSSSGELSSPSTSMNLVTSLLSKVRRELWGFVDPELLEVRWSDGGEEGEEFDSGSEEDEYEEFGEDDKWRGGVNALSRFPQAAVGGDKLLDKSTAGGSGKGSNERSGSPHPTTTTTTTTKRKRCECMGTEKKCPNCMESGARGTNNALLGEAVEPPWIKCLPQPSERPTVFLDCYPAKNGESDGGGTMDSVSILLVIQEAWVLLQQLPFALARGAWLKKGSSGSTTSLPPAPSALLHYVKCWCALVESFFSSPSIVRLFKVLRRAEQQRCLPPAAGFEALGFLMPLPDLLGPTNSSSSSNSAKKETTIPTPSPPPPPQPLPQKLHQFPPSRLPAERRKLTLELLKRLATSLRDPTSVFPNPIPLEVVFSSLVGEVQGAGEEQQSKSAPVDPPPQPATESHTSPPPASSASPSAVLAAIRAAVNLQTSFASLKRRAQFWKAHIITYVRSEKCLAWLEDGIQVLEREIKALDEKDPITESESSSLPSPLPLFTVESGEAIRASIPNRTSTFIELRDLYLASLRERKFLSAPKSSLL